VIKGYQVSEGKNKRELHFTNSVIREKLISLQLKSERKKEK
jgi:hypothetical protein